MDEDHSETLTIGTPAMLTREARGWGASVHVSGGAFRNALRAISSSPLALRRVTATICRASELETHTSAPPGHSNSICNNHLQPQAERKAARGLTAVSGSSGLPGHT